MKVKKRKSQSRIVFEPQEDKKKKKKYEKKLYTFLT